MSNCGKIRCGLLGPRGIDWAANGGIVKRYAINRHKYSFVAHELMRHELQDERKSEMQKLERLEKLLQTKVEAKLEGAAAIRAA
jgi:hypothetical protein